jgi:hypothetical protein
MRPLTLDDLLPLEEYVGRRPEFFAAQARYLDRYRRVRVGPQVTLVFENRQTLWFRVQELLRVARLADPLRVQQELDWYNRLLPGRDRLQAALVIDMPEGPEWGEQVQFWSDLAGEHVRMCLEEEAVPARLVTCRPEDRCAGTAHWLEFAVAGGTRRALADGRTPVFIAVAYKTYQHQSAPLSDAIRRSLLDDLELSDRDRAA